MQSDHVQLCSKVMSHFLWPKTHTHLSDGLVAFADKRLFLSESRQRIGELVLVHDYSPIIVYTHVHVMSVQS